MEEAIKGYIAGIIDGEGTICVIRCDYESYYKTYNRKWPYYFICIRAGMIDKQAIHLIHKETGLGILETEKSYGGKRPMYRWRIHKREQAKEFLEIFLPYLRVKKQQAILALDFIKNYKRCHISNPITQEIEDERRSYWERMRTLNGIVSPATTKPSDIKGKARLGRARGVLIETIV
jgi:hypothetical protein